MQERVVSGSADPVEVIHVDGPDADPSEPMLEHVVHLSTSRDTNHLKGRPYYKIAHMSFGVS